MNWYVEIAQITNKQYMKDDGKQRHQHCDRITRQLSSSHSC